jgi:hypothetical protein
VTRVTAAELKKLLLKKAESKWDPVRRQMLRSALG